MDALQVLMALMLTFNEPCTALPDARTTRGGRDYKIETYRCGDAMVRLWSSWCRLPAVAGEPRAARGEGYWSRPFLLEDERSGKGVYLNRFAELQVGWHVMIDEVYLPRCGT